MCLQRQQQEHYKLNTSRALPVVRYNLVVTVCRLERSTASCWQCTKQWPWVQELMNRSANGNDLLRNSCLLQHCSGPRSTLYTCILFTISYVVDITNFRIMCTKISWSADWIVNSQLNHFKNRYKPNNKIIKNWLFIIKENEKFYELNECKTIKQISIIILSCAVHTTKWIIFI